MTAPPGSEAIRGVEEHRFVDRLQDTRGQLLDDLVFRAADPQGTRGAVLLGNLDPSYRLGPVRPLMQFLVQRLEVGLQMLPIHRFRDSIDSGRLRSIERLEACSQVVHREVVHQRRVARLRLLARPSGYPLDSRGRRGSTSACGRRCHRAVYRMCPPLLRGRYPTSSLIWGHPTSSWTVGFPPGVPVVPPYPLPWRSPEDLPSSRLCRGDVPRSSTPVGSREPWPSAPLIWPSVMLTTSAPTVPVHNGAQSLHACALRPITSLCTLRRWRYRQRRNTRYPVPGQGFRGQDLPLTDKAELCSAH